jgi:hypothetical protein
MPTNVSQLSTKKKGDSTRKREKEGYCCWWQIVLPKSLNVAKDNLPPVTTTGDNYSPVTTTSPEITYRW